MTNDPLQQLDQKITKLRQEKKRQEEGSGPSSSSYGMRAGMDLVSGVAVGTGVGYAVDAWLGTLPWFSLICFCFGLAAGIRLMMETASKAAAALEKEEKRNNAQEP